jgi:hypothetical protein
LVVEKRASQATGPTRRGGACGAVRALYEPIYEMNIDELPVVELACRLRFLEDLT